MRNIRQIVLIDQEVRREGGRETATRTRRVAACAVLANPFAGAPPLDDHRGHWALWLSQRLELPVGATVTFYGARSGDYTDSRAAFLGHFAEKDDWVSDAALKKLENHWCFESDRADAYTPEAAELAWERTLTFLRKHLKKC